jgi:replicative DNA helicase
MPLDIKDVRQLLEREQGEHGIEQVVFDYDWLISAPGKDEIATSQHISRTLKTLAHEMNLSVLLVSSVNKMGMDTTAENLSNVSGSGKKLHDADVVYLLTKFNEKKNSDNSIMPSDYPHVATLHFKKAREMDYHVPNNVINFIREIPKPTFRELKPMKERTLPDWMQRKDMA